MNRGLILSILGMTLIFFTQVLLLRNVAFFDVAFCFIYIYFLLTLKLEINTIPALLIGFAYGLGLDLFYDSPGIHASACVALMFFRPYWVNLLTPQGGYDTGVLPSVRSMGVSWFISYSLPLVLLHHLVLFFVEASGFNWFWFTLVKVVASTLVSMSILVGIQYLFARK